MIIKSIELENIRSYENCHIDFIEGINFLSGDIGSGKSSILQAIEFALFGFKRGDLEGFQLLRKGESKGRILISIINSKTNETLEICRNLKKTKSSDVISQESGYIKVNDNILELSAQELNAYVFNLLNLPIEFLTKDKNLVYRFTIYTPQEQLKEILFTSPDKRLEIIRKIFGIDKYKQLRDSIDIYLSKLKENKKLFSLQLESKEKTVLELKNLEEELSKLEIKLDLYLKKEKEFESKLEKYKTALEKRENVLEDIRKKTLELEKNKSKTIDTQKYIEKLKTDINHKKKTLENINTNEITHLINKKIEIKKEKIKELEQISKEKKLLEKDIIKYENFNVQKETLNNKIIEFEYKQKEIDELAKSFDYMLTKCKIKDLENAIAKNKVILEKNKNIDEEFKLISQEILKNELILENFNKSIEEKNKQTINLSTLEFCTTCHQQVSEIHKKKISKNINDEIKKINEKIKDLQKLIIELEKELLVKKKLLESINELKENDIKNRQKLSNLLEIEINEQKLNEKLINTKKELKKTDKKEILNNLRLIDEELKNISKSRELISNLSQKEIGINNEIAKAGLELNRLEDSQKEKVKVEDEIKELNKEVEEKSKEIKNIDEITHNLKENLEKEKGIKTEIVKIKEYIEKLHENLRIISNKTSSIKTMVENLQKNIIQKITDVEKQKKIETQYIKLLKKEKFLSKKVSNISADIEKALFTKFYCEFSEEFETIFRELIEDNDIEVRLDEEFSPIIEQNGYDTDIKNLSGGEKSSVALAYRLALKKIIEYNLSSMDKLSLLILDEPTDGFSNEQIDRLGNVLKSTNLKQIILVSHDEKIESIAENVLKIEKINHVSMIN